MGNIGKERRKIEVLPLSEPAPGRADPAVTPPAPAEPNRAPDPQPTR